MLNDLRDLSRELDARGLSMTVHNVGQMSWVVWLFAPDDPEIGTFVGESDDLILAISYALSQWDVAPSEKPS